MATVRDERLASRPLRLAVEVAGLVTLVGLIGWIDYRTGPSVSFSLLYLAPIVAAAWWLERPAAWAAALAAAVFQFSADYAWFDASQFLVITWNAFTRLVFFSGAVVALTNIRDRRDRERREAAQAGHAAEAERARLAAAV